MERITKEQTHGITPSLLWEYDLTKFDWWEYRDIVVQRIIERGQLSDFHAAYKLYGGRDNFREIIKEIHYLEPRDLNFVCFIYDLKKEELSCYQRQLRRKQLLYSK